MSAVPGVYGLQLRGLEGATLMGEVDASAPALEVSIEVGRVGDRVERFEDDRAEISLIDHGWISLSRAGEAHFVLPAATPVDEVLHPWLVPAAATFSGWCGRDVLHGGAFARADRAVAVLGEKEDGKSSLLAWLARTEGVDVLTDDLLVIEQGSVFSGPRCIDLRPGSAEAVQTNGSRLVRSDSRLRLELSCCPGRASLAAIVVLAWAEDKRVQLRRLSPSEGIARLLPHALSSGGGTQLLDLFSLPVWVLERPRTWASMDEVTSRLLSLLG